MISRRMRKRKIPQTARKPSAPKKRLVIVKPDSCAGGFVISFAVLLACSGGFISPSSVFVLRCEFGIGYSPPLPPGGYLDISCLFLDSWRVASSPKSSKQRGYG